jgi:hypothetical protein
MERVLKWPGGASAGLVCNKVDIIERAQIKSNFCRQNHMKS